MLIINIVTEEIIFFQYLQVERNLKLDLIQLYQKVELDSKSKQQ